MWIRGYKLQKNVPVPYYVNEQIRLYVDSLVDQLKQELPVKYSVSLDKSRQSEACYISIKDNKSGKSAKISFRNHEGNSDFDVAVYLSEFRNWVNCKRYFLKEILPSILAETEKTSRA